MSMAPLTNKTNGRTIKAMGKGEHTRLAILDAALAQASECGFESLTIGSLAERAGLSKSGLFAHFGSREELQIAAIGVAAERFVETVFRPALKAPRGLPRLQALFDHWLAWTESSGLAHGCPMQAAAVEFDDRPGPVRDALAAMVQAWHAALERAIRIAVEEGHLRPDTDAQQMLFEIHGLILALHHDARFLRVPGALDRARAGFARLVAHYATAKGRRADGIALAQP